MLKRILVPMLLVAATIAGLILLWNSDIWLFCDMYAFILVPVIASLFAFCAFGFREGAAAFSVPFKPEAAGPELRSAKAFFELLGQSYSSMAFLGAIVSIIDMLKNLTDKKMIGPRMALALISLEYAAVLVLLVVIPYRTAIKKRLAALKF